MSKKEEELQALPPEETAAEENGKTPAPEEKPATDANSLVGEETEDEGIGEIAVTDIGTFGDHIIEDFSVESNIKKVSEYTKIPATAAKYILSVLYIVLGAVCAAIPAKIEHSLPYIVGGGLAVMSVVQFIFAVIKKEYRRTDSNRTASALIMAGLAVMIILEHEWAHTFIPIVWGVLGLCEGAHAFNLALSRISRGMRCSYYIIKGIVEVAVAFLLLYKPEEYGELHIIVFGVSLIIDGVTNIPILKKFFTRH